jgi:hypothetical protein
MAQIDRVINAENIARFVDQLSRERDPERRASLQQQLLEQEDRYGLHSWHLDLIGQHIAETAKRVEEQTLQLSHLENNGHNAELARPLLETLNRAQQHSMRFRDYLKHALNR